MSISFLLNNEKVVCDLPEGAILLDYIRYHQHAAGTKIGCREGDCGACTLLIGSLDEDRVVYRSMTSCLTPVGNVAGKHVVTIEGLNLPELSPVQQAVVDEGGTQCGFCTVGFVVSLTGYCMDGRAVPEPEGAVAAMNGNICRCTGYKSLERAAEVIVRGLLARDSQQPMQWLIDQHYLPAYFAEIPERLKALASPPQPPGSGRIVGGGTDLYVQRPEAMAQSSPQLVFGRKELCGIDELEGEVKLGAAVTAEELRLSPVMNRIFPAMPQFMKLVSSTPIRNMGTLAGNLVNASPIGDLSIFFLALGSRVHLQGPGGTRVVALKEFFKSYKVLDLASDERITALSFPHPGAQARFNFEKVSKRTHLDIASVNSAMLLQAEGDTIQSAMLSAGGVFETPLFLKKTAAFLAGRRICVQTVQEAVAVAAGEIKPISDIRGTLAYKQLLLRQLIFAHFLTFFPETLSLEALV